MKTDDHEEILHPAIPTAIVLDQQLVPGARACLVLIRALIGRGSSRMITKRCLAQELGVCSRTVQRYLRRMREEEYITVEPIYDASGRQIGQRIVLAEKMRPFWKVEESTGPYSKDPPPESDERVASATTHSTEIGFQFDSLEIG